MKNLLIATIALFFSATVCLGANDLATIRGTWNRKNAPIKLYAAENGTLKQLAAYNTSDDGAFYFAFAPEKEGFYVIGTNDAGRTNNFTFYFKPGDRLNVDIKGGEYTLAPGNSPENVEMERWHKLMAPLAAKFFGNSTYVDFFPLLEQKAAEAGAFKQKYTKNAAFNKNFQDFRKFDLTHTALNFLNIPHSAHPKADDFVDYYAAIDLRDMAGDGDLLNYPYGMDIITIYSMVAPMFAADKFSEEQKQMLRKPIEALNVMLPAIGNDVLKGETVLQRAKYLRTYAGYLDFEEKYGKYLITAHQKQEFKSLLATVADNKPNETATNFTFEDIDGKQVSLTDLKGKLVYIDVWATWCGPCLAEIPALKKLEEEYHGKDVVFVSVSTDKSADRQKWKDMVKEKELRGIQLLAGDKANGEMLNPYKIKGIPHFILIDRDGKLISINAPRPSSSEIRPVLNAELKK